MLSPEIYSDERFALMSAEAQVLMIGLLNLADREGRLEDKPRSIGLKLHPGAARDTNALIQEIADAGLVVRYSVEERPLIAIPEFLAKGSPWCQTPHPNETASTLSPPDNHGPPPVPPRSSNGATKVSRDLRDVQKEEREDGSDPRQKGEEEKAPPPRATSLISDPDLKAALQAFADAEQKTSGITSEPYEPAAIEELRHALEQRPQALPHARKLAELFFSRDGKGPKDTWWKERLWSLHVFATQAIETLLPEILQGGRRSAGDVPRLPGKRIEAAS